MINLTALQLSRAREALQHIPKAAPKAIAAAINRSAESAKTEAGRKAVENYNVLARDVKNTIHIQKASANARQILSVISSSGPRIPLIKFKVRPGGITSRTSPIIKVAVLKGGGVKAMPKAFITKGKSSGIVNVLQRQTKERYPIHIKYGPAIPEMIGAEKVKKFVESRAIEVLDNRLEHEISRILRGVGL